ncbi:RNA-binding protein 34-like [Pomacea canaliculata]|uniref:RNA-binding protein 34-like n=1 Tax=Pomacea canaliculata TaxID=400727 RepID=UPI000D72B3A6|nr:RNA-binding protein 34-like [Pomacea canaliculata]
MEDTEYTPGLVAQILGNKEKKKSSEKSDKRLTSLFAATKLATPLYASPPVLKNQVEKISSAASGSKIPGFNPPPGIVHESLRKADKADRTQKKRAKSSIAEDDSDEEERRELKRPRRDRLKKVTEKRTIFVGNVPLSFDKKKLAKLFREFGEIESIRFRCAPVADLTLPKRVSVIKKEFHEQRHNIAAYICFTQEAAAKTALNLNGHLVDGLHLRVDLACKEKHDNARSVFVGNLPFTIEEESVRSHFTDCGEIDNVRIIRDRKTNLGKGFCYVLFKSKDSVSLAMKLQGLKLEGRELRIQRCSEQPTQSKQLKKSALTPTGKGKETKREHRKSWGPSNATAALRGTKTSFFKTLAKRNKSKKKKVDEVTRVLGPASQPAVPHVKRGVNRKGKLKGNKNERVSRKGKSKDSKKGAKFSSGRSKKIKRN